MNRASRLSLLSQSLWVFGFLGGWPLLGAAGQESNPNVERVRRDLGYYREAEAAKEAADVEAQIQALREEFRQAMQRQDERIRRIEEGLEQLQAKSAAPSLPPSASPAPRPALPVPGLMPKDKLSVCSQGCDFQDLQKAVNAASAGGTITLAAEINGSCAVINKPVHIKGLRGSNGRRAHLVGGVCNGKGPLVTAAKDIVIEGLEISGIRVGDGNGACVRLDKGTRDLLIRDLYCHDSQDGVLGIIAGMLLVEDSQFVGNGFGGQAHGLYVYGDEVLIRRSQILSTQNAGHSLKVGAQKLTVEDSVIAALNGHNSRALDAFAGGVIELRNNVIQQGPASDNSDVIGLGLEPKRLLPSGHSFLAEDNWVIFDNPDRSHKIFIRGQVLGPIVVRNNVFVGMDGLGVDAAKDEGNRWFADRKEVGLPAFDGSLASLPSPGKSPVKEGGLKPK